MNTPYIYPSGDKVFTIPEIAAYLKISKSKIYYPVSQKQIPHLKVGMSVRIRESHLQKWRELQTEKMPSFLRSIS